MSDRMAMGAAVHKPEGQYIGRAGVIASEGGLGFYLARAYWGRGLATEAGRAFVNFGFNTYRGS
jgi:ribosomal-protein-alanine N-acetyltransferase